jgi:2-polyprenyl-3-methyl-5-hydroxy-6-metoxy-1,4-benzoquinol methylase|tara:strand:- start:6145 stop:6744 length:600 start_codon:yes stop_codon:yes gene_type:complete
MAKDEIIKDFFNKLVEKHGYSPKSLAYSGEKSQKIKFNIVTEVGIEDNCSVLDVGCGFGDYFNYLKQQGIKNVKYCGIDISNKIVDFAKEKNSLANVIQGNVLDLSDDEKYDYVISLGFNCVKTGTNWETLTQVLDKMWKLSKKGIAYNAVSTFSETSPRKIYFVSPAKVIDYIMTNLTYKVVFRHDYMPHDFTIFAYK